MPASHKAARLIAGVMALTSLAACMLGPMLIVRLAAGGPLSGQGPSWEIWLLVAGGGIGAGVARYVHHRILVGHFSLDVREEESAWKGRRT